MVQQTTSTAIRTLFDNLTEASHSVKDKLEEFSAGEARRAARLTSNVCSS